MIPQFSIAGFITCLATFSLGSLVFLRNRQSNLNKIFFFYSLAISQWSFFTALHSIVNSEKISFFAARAMHLGVALIPILFFHFCTEILGLNKKQRAKLVIGYLISIVLIIANFSSPLIVPGVKAKLGYHYFMNGGALYPFLILYFSTYVIFGLLILFKGYINAQGNKRNQLKFLFYGSVLGYSFGPSCFLPVYNITIFPYPFGSYAITIYVGITAMAIIKYGLLDIEALIKRTAIFAGLSAFTLGLIVFSSSLIQDVLGPAVGLSKIGSQFLSAITIVALYDLIKKVLIEVTDKFLFQKKHDPVKILKNFSRNVLTELELDKIVASTKKIIDETIHPEHFSIYLWDIVKGSYLAQGEGDGAHSFGINSKLVEMLHKSDEFILTEGNKQNHKKSNLDDIKNELNSLKVVLALPLQHQEKLLGFMLLGKKKSDEEYSEGDLEILTDLALEETIAINNSLASIELAKSRSHKHLADLADGFSHQVNNRFYALMTIVDTFIQNSPFERKALDKLSGEEKYKKLEALFEKALKKLGEVHEQSALGGEIAKTILLQTRPEKVSSEMLDVSVGIKLARTVGEMKYPDFGTVIEIVPKIAEGIPQTYTRKVTLQEIIWTSLDNSYRAIKDRQGVEPGHKGIVEITMSYNPSTAYIRIELKDNGTGMHDHQLNAVNGFAPLFTTKASSDQKAGYGKGVFMIAYYVMTVLKGRLRFESGWMKGTTLIVEFPVAKEPIKKEEAQEEKAQSA